MEIIRTEKEVIIKLPLSVNIEDLQELVDYLTYKAATANSQAKQSDVDALAAEVKGTWWAENRSRFI